MTRPNQAGELLPCPFCGGEASDAGHTKYSRPLNDTTWTDGSPVTEAFFVNCIPCGASSRNSVVGGYQTKAEAIAAWNRRASPSALPAQGEASKAHCQKCGGDVEGWTCQTCGQGFRENDSGDLVFDAQGEAEGMREKVLDELDRAWLHGRWDRPWDRAKAADAILALTGRGKADE